MSLYAAWNGQMEAHFVLLGILVACCHSKGNSVEINLRYSPGWPRITRQTYNKGRNEGGARGSRAPARYDTIREVDTSDATRQCSLFQSLFGKLADWKVNTLYCCEEELFCFK